MRQFCQPRLLLSGLIAGMIIGASQYLLDSFVFADSWTSVARHIAPAAGATPAAFAWTSRKLEVFMQLVALVAGLLAVRLGVARRAHKHASGMGTALFAWLVTYGGFCAAIAWLARGKPDPAHPPIKLADGIGFALAGLVVCQTGSWIGNWIYRESEQISAEREVQTKAVKEEGKTG